MEWWKCWWTRRIEDLKQRLEDKKLIVEKKGKALKNMITQKKRKLVILRRLGLRKDSTGRPLTLDDVDENFILQCIENKSTALGRRNNWVIYVGRCVTKHDFLKIANLSRLSHGLKLIKSATTVCNRARPKNKRSIQAKRHLGLGLCSCKKPPKLKDTDNLLAHHQGAFRRNILMKRCSEPEDERYYNLFISRDDKAYICPGTGTGKLFLLFWICYISI